MNVKKFGYKLKSLKDKKNEATRKGRLLNGEKFKGVNGQDEKRS